MSASQDPNAPPGWYPVDAMNQRYWDGRAWTEHIAPLDAGTEPSNDERTIAVLIHVLSLFSSFLAPLIIWLVKRDQSPFIDHHGKEALNFQITMFIAWSTALVLVFVLIGLLLLPILFVIQIVVPIVAAVGANKGMWYRYPLTLRLLR